MRFSFPSIVAYSQCEFNEQSTKTNHVYFLFIKQFVRRRERKKMWMNRLQADNIHFQAWILDSIQISAASSVNLFYAHSNLRKKETESKKRLETPVFFLFFNILL